MEQYIYSESGILHAKTYCCGVIQSLDETPRRDVFHVISHFGGSTRLRWPIAFRRFAAPGSGALCSSMATMPNTKAVVSLSTAETSRENRQTNNNYYYCYCCGNECHFVTTAKKLIPNVVVMCAWTAAAVDCEGRLR